jgi:hypothetical protein
MIQEDDHELRADTNPEESSRYLFKDIGRLNKTMKIFRHDSWYPARNMKLFFPGLKSKTFTAVPTYSVTKN